MTSKGHALSRDELIRALTAYTGITTADGLANGTTLIDSNLIGKDSQKIVEKTILIISGVADWEDKGASAFNTLTGQITLQGTGFSAQIKAGTIYRILNISSVEIDVANINTKIGTNTDAAGTTTLFAWMANLLAVHGEAQGLAYYGEVTNVVDATHFDVSALIGKGDAFFANNYRVYVLRDAAGGGAAPQGEMQPCSGYTSASGRFTHTAFTVGLAANDEVLLLHERVAQIADLISWLGYEGATALANKLTAARAALLDQITALRMGELDAANIPADIDTLLTRVTAAVALASSLTSHDTDIKALLATIAGYIDTEVAAIKTQTDKIAGKMLFSMDFWSDPVEEKAVTNAQVTAAVGAPVTVANLPDGATVVRAIVMMKFRMVENTNVAENSLDCTAVQPIQVDDSANNGWVNAIDFVDEQFKIAAETREGGDVLIGDNNVAARVDGNDTYDFQWLNAKAHLANIQFNDIQMGIRIWYSI